MLFQLLENHRREVYQSLNGPHDDSLDRSHLSSPSLVPEALADDDDDDNDNNSRQSSQSLPVKDTDISKDIDDLKSFVAETQSKSRRFDDLGGEDSPDASPRAGSSIETGARERDFPPLPDFSDFEQIDFNSSEVDPDLLSVSKIFERAQYVNQLHVYCFFLSTNLIKLIEQK